MKKSLIAMAVAGIAAAPMAAQSAGHTGGMSISGNMTMAYKMGDDVNEVISDDNTLVFSGADDLGNGMEAYGNIRLDMGTSNDGAVAPDAIVAGVRGDFGDVGIGEVQNGIDYAQRANDIIDVSTAQEAAIGYKNTFGAITFAASHSPDGEQDGNTIGVEANFGMFTIGVGTEEHGVTDADKSGFGASADFGDFGVDFHSIDHDGEDGVDDVTAFRVRYGAGALSASFTSATGDLTGGGELDKTRLDVGYALSDRTSINYRNETSDVEADEYSWILLDVALGDNS